MAILPFKPCPQPALPAGFPWPPLTVEWWARWGRCPQAVMFGETDWDFLADTALLHATAWASAQRAVETGSKIDTSQHQELRLRVAKFGATVEDRARLRIMFADADAKDAERGADAEGEEPKGARERRGALYALPTGDAAGSSA